MTNLLKISSLLGMGLFISACSQDEVASGSAQEAGTELRGTVSLDGSSTVYPISEAIAEEFLAVAPRGTCHRRGFRHWWGFKNSWPKKPISMTPPGP